MKQRRETRNSLCSILYLFGIYLKPGSPSGGNPGKYSALLSKAISILEEERSFLKDDLTITKLSRVTGTNRTYLSKAFNDSGTSFTEYINKLRVREAKRAIDKIIKTGNRPVISDISEISGFGSLRALNRCFKKAEGVTPAMYIKIEMAKFRRSQQV